MKHSLSVIIRADVAADEIRIIVRGCVTEQSETALHPILRRALALDPEAPVIVDLRETSHCEATAVALLEEAILALDAVDPHQRPVQVLAPDPPPLCPQLADTQIPDSSARSDA
jgi:hypothetical protein